MRAVKAPFQGERMKENFGGDKKGCEKCCWGSEARLPLITFESCQEGLKLMYLLFILICVYIYKYIR